MSKFHIKNNTSSKKTVVKHDFRWDNIPSSFINRDIVDIEGYTWDLIILLPNPDYHSYDRNKYKNQMTCELLAEKLTKGKLDYYFYYSIDKEEIICKVRARLERLKEYAESAGKKLKLSETVVGICSSYSLSFAHTYPFNYLLVQRTKLMTKIILFLMILISLIFHHTNLFMQIIKETEITCIPRPRDMGTDSRHARESCY